MTYELIIMRRRNSQIVDIFRTNDIVEFRKVKRHIISCYKLSRVRKGRANMERYSQARGMGSDYILTVKTSSSHLIKGILETAGKCFVREEESRDQDGNHSSNETAYRECEEASLQDDGQLSNESRGTRHVQALQS